MTESVPITDPSNIPAVNLEAFRDRCVTLVTGVSTTIEELLSNADIMQHYILNGVNPFVPEDPGPPPDFKSL